MKKRFYLLMIALVATLQLSGLLFWSVSLQAQPLFSVVQNRLSEEVVAQLKTQIENSEISPLSLAKNNGNKEIYPVSFTSVQNSKIIILNEKTGNNVVITPRKKSLSEFQLSPFFIEELRQGILGDAGRYLIVETWHAASLSEFSVKKVSSVSTAHKDVYIPRYFYGTKENVKEALPRNRQIINIYKAKPRYISAFPDDMELQRRLAQLEEEKSYYVYMFKLPDGTLCTYDEHFNADNRMDASTGDGPLQFDLTSSTTGEVHTAVQHALGLWSETLAGKVPVDIKVDLVPLDEPGVLGLSYISSSFLHAPTNTYYASAQWNQIVGYDATPMRDIVIESNSNFGWYFGLDGNVPHDLFDFVSVVLHEVNHGLGFMDNVFWGIDGEGEGVFWYNNEYGNMDEAEYPNAFTRQLFLGESGPCIVELDEEERWNTVISDNLYAGCPGSKLLATNGGVRVKMFAPNPYMQGSSVAHWDNSVSFPTFMKAAIGNGRHCHIIGAHEIAMLLDMGWTQVEVGIEEKAKTPFSIMPNPVTSSITISSESNFNFIEIMNFLGQSVISQTTEGNTASLNVENLNKGVYFVRITTASGSSVQKFMKQ